MHKGGGGGYPDSEEPDACLSALSAHRPESTVVVGGDDSASSAFRDSLEDRHCPAQSIYLSINKVIF